MTWVSVVVGAVCFVIGVGAGGLIYGWVIALSLSKGRLPKSLENIGFTLPERYKKLGDKE